MQTLTPQKKREIDNQVGRALAQNPAYRKLSERERQQILTSTQAIVGQLAKSQAPVKKDPYATAQALPPLQPIGQAPNSNMKADSINAGVDQLKRFTGTE